MEKHTLCNKSYNGATSKKNYIYIYIYMYTILSKLSKIYKFAT